MQNRTAPQIAPEYIRFMGPPQNVTSIRPGQPSPGHRWRRLANARRLLLCRTAICDPATGTGAHDSAVRLALDRVPSRAAVSVAAVRRHAENAKRKAGAFARAL